MILIVFLPRSLLKMVISNVLPILLIRRRNLPKLKSMPSLVATSS